MPTDNELTISVPEAGERFFGLSRNGSYAAASRGDIPTIKIGRLLRVPRARAGKDARPRRRGGVTCPDPINPLGRCLAMKMPGRVGARTRRKQF